MSFKGLDLYFALLLGQIEKSTPRPNSVRFRFEPTNFSHLRNSCYNVIFKKIHAKVRFSQHQIPSKEKKLHILFNAAQTTPGPSQNMDYIP